MWADLAEFFRDNGWVGWFGAAVALAIAELISLDFVLLMLAAGATGGGTPGANGRGTLAVGVLEMSNVDLAQEFTNMIVAQRGFQANSRIITTSDELLQELVNLKR